MLKKVICLICAFTFMFSVFCIPASAENANGHIKIDNLTAINGDTVLVQFKILENPGIMAMTVSITYDSSALTYKGHRVGLLKDYMFTDYPSQNVIRFVSCDSNNNTKNGRMFTLEFKVKEDADFGSYPITVNYKSGDFCNSDMEIFMPKVTAGGINIEYDGTNCKHRKYSSWETVADPSCEQKGAKQRSCKKCGHIDIRETDATGHDFEKNWTVDKAATKETEGIMSRHCKNCEKTTDVITFSLEESKEEKIENKVHAVVKPSDTTDKMLEEQSNIITDKDNSSDNSSNNSNSSSDSSSIEDQSDSSNSSEVNNLKDDNESEEEKQSSSNSNVIIWIVASFALLVVIVAVLLILLKIKKSRV